MSYETKKFSAEIPHGLSADNSYFYKNLKYSP